jgi:adenosylmethionine-8-amino-7-oxononanoate aminotransferase
VVSRHRIAAEARGTGLLWAIEIVKDPETREAFPADEDIGTRLVLKLRSKGLLTRAGNLLHIAPPLVINREEMGTIVEIIDDTLTELEAEL